MSSDNTGYAEGFEAGRKAALALVRKWRDDAAEFPDTRSQMMKNICQNLSTAIGVLPSPAGVEVTVEELAQAARDADFNAGNCLGTDTSESYERMASILLSHFTILAKPAQEPRS